MKQSLIYIFIISSLILYSCHKDKSINSNDGLNDSKDVKLSLTIEYPTSLPSSRAGDTQKELQIETIDILSFSVIGNEEKYFYSINNSNTVITDQGSTKLINTVIQKSDTTQRFVLIINAREQLQNAGPFDNTMTKEDILSPILFSKKTNWSTTTGEFTPLPMWGETAKEIINDEDTELTLKLLRMVARVDVYLGKDIIDFSLENMRIYNAKSRGYLVPSYDNIVYDSQQKVEKVDCPTLPLDNNNSDPLNLPDPLQFNATSNEFPTVYLFESDSVENSSDATCLVIGAFYQNDEDLTYYRIDFVTENEDNTTSFIPILRNHRYIFNITGIKGRGYPTPEEAYKASGYNTIDVKLYEWDMGDIIEFAYNSDYVLGVSQKNFEVPYPEETYDLLVTTDYTGGWKASVDDTKYNWLSIVSAHSTVANAKDVLMFRVSPNLTSSTRTGYIEITAGPLSLTITVIQTIDDIVELFIKDELDNDINELIFVRYPDYNTPTSQELKVSWAPLSFDVAVSNMKIGNLPFDYGAADNLNAITSISNGPKSFNILPSAFTNQEISENPFLNKSSLITFKLNAYSSEIQKSVALLHKSYDLVGEMNDIYYLDGSVQSLKVKSNTIWTASIASNDTISQLITTSGGNNTEGETLEFRMVNDPDKLIGTGTATIEFRCTTEYGDTFTKKLVINTTSDDPPIVGANTYMLKPNGNSVEIPITWANVDGVKRIRPTDNVNVEFVWTDNPNGMSTSGPVKSLEIQGAGVNRKLVVTSGNSIGNAVVGVSVDGKLAWSWLIWVTDYDPDNGDITYSNNGFVFMDRYLGAETNGGGKISDLGLYFQWARKDPFPRASILYVVQTPSVINSIVYNKDRIEINPEINQSSLNDNMEFAIQNPLTLFSGTRPKTDYYLWKKDDGSKGIFDPCPEGWRLPPNSSTESPWINTAQKWYNDNTDRYLNLYNTTTNTSLGTWQAPGIIVSTGSYSMLGVYVCSWSNDVHPTNNNAYSFLGGNIKYEIQSSRPLNQALNVRCVREY